MYSRGRTSRLTSMMRKSVSAPSFRMGEKEIAHCAGLLLGIQPRIEQFLQNA